jgi:hypothetical protein
VDVERFDPGLPPGTAALALATAERAAAAATRVTGTEHRVDRTAVLAHLLLPLVVGDAVVPAPPRAVAGGGAVHVDVLAEDEALLAALVDGAPHADAEALAAAAQECRLPVTPYRTGAVAAAAGRPATPTRRVVAPASVTVVDMTAMWAGPLATMVLAEWGARVVTVEPTSRRDGLRGSPAQFAVLDRGKQRRPWDLRLQADRSAFEAELAAADVLVESFSDRVLPNLGYPADVLLRINPRLVVVTVRAFAAARPEASWVAYGRGVHAMSGRGVIGGEPTPSLLAYPDPLAGLLTVGVVLDALGDTIGGVHEVSLDEAIGPLLGRGPAAALGDVDAAALAELRARTGTAPGPVLRRA